MSAETTYILGTCSLGLCLAVILALALGAGGPRSGGAS